MELVNWQLTNNELNAAWMGFSAVVGPPRRDPRVFGLDPNVLPIAATSPDLANALIAAAAGRDDLLCDAVAIRKQLVARFSRWWFGRNHPHAAGHDPRFQFALLGLSRSAGGHRGFAFPRGIFATLQAAALAAEYLDLRDERDGLYPGVNRRTKSVYLVTTGLGVERRRRAGVEFTTVPTRMETVPAEVWADDSLVITTEQALAAWAESSAVAAAAKRVATK